MGFAACLKFKLQSNLRYCNNQREYMLNQVNAKLNLFNRLYKAKQNTISEIKPVNYASNIRLLLTTPVSHQSLLISRSL